jgi:hypothetical protein
MGSGIRKQLGQALDPSPALAFRHRFDSQFVKIVVEHRGPFLGEWRLAIILFLPNGDAISANPRAAKRGREGTAERPQRHELVALKTRAKFVEAAVLGDRRHQVECLCSS